MILLTLVLGIGSSSMLANNFSAMNCVISEYCEWNWKWVDVNFCSECWLRTYIPCQDAIMVSGSFFDFMPPLGNWGLLFYVSYHLPPRGGVTNYLQRHSVNVWGLWTSIWFFWLSNWALGRPLRFFEFGWSWELGVAQFRKRVMGANVVSDGGFLVLRRGYA